MTVRIVKFDDILWKEEEIEFVKLKIKQGYLPSQIANALEVSLLKLGILCLYLIETGEIDAQDYYKGE